LIEVLAEEKSLEGVKGDFINFSYLRNLIYINNQNELDAYDKLLKESVRIQFKGKKLNFFRNEENHFWRI